MHDTPTETSDPRTPGRRRTLASNLARADLARRLRALALPEDAVARVVRLLEDELSAALEAQARDLFSGAELEEAGAEPALLETLRRRRREREQVEAIRAAGLADLDPVQLEQVLAEARVGGR